MGSDVISTEECHSNNTIHFSTAEEAQLVMFSNFEIISRVSILPIILVVGLVGNGTFLFTVIRVRSMRTATNFYLSNLAVSDSMFLLIVIIPKLTEYFRNGVPNESLGKLGCVLEIFSTYAFNFAGMILITFISLERYMAVCHPLRHRLISGHGRSVKLVAVCWLIALLLAPLVIPANLKFTQYCLSWPEDKPELYTEFPTIIGMCSGVAEWAVQLFHLTQTIPFFVAFFGNAFFYTCILLKLHKRDTYDRQRIIHTRNQVAVMLVANGTVFFLTLTSFEVTSMILFIEDFSDDILIPYEVRNVLFEVNRILLYINSAVNPIVYTVTNARYRRAFRRAFMTCRGRRLQNSTFISNVTHQAHNVYQLSSIYPSVPDRPAPVAENGVAGPYVNMGFDNEDGTMEDRENEDATTVFPRKETNREKM